MSKLIKLATLEAQRRVELSIRKLSNQSDNVSDLDSFLQARLANKPCEINDDEFIKAVEEIKNALDLALTQLHESEKWLDAIGGAA